MTAVGAVRAAVDWANPAWFAADLDVRGGRIAMLRIEPDVVERSTFMDTRIAADLRQSLPFGAADVPSHLDEVPPPAWLFHTSFCGSTLLSRALHDHPRTMVYREPLVLRRLADARQEGLTLGSWVNTCTELLARPWMPGGGIVVKPTHGALNIAADLMTAVPGARAVAVTSSLEDFLVSHFKKPRETLLMVPELCKRLLGVASTAPNYPEAALAPPSLLAAVGLQWALQREVLLDIALAHPDRLRIVDMHRLLESLPEVAQAFLAWTRIGHDAGTVRSRAIQIAGQHAKAPGRAFNARDREKESQMLRHAYAGELAAAMQWVETQILPHVRPGAVELASAEFAL